MTNYFKLSNVAFCVKNFTKLLCNNFYTFDQYATLDNAYKWKKNMRWLAQKRDPIFQLLMDFIDFKMYSIAAYKTLSLHLNNFIWFLHDMPQKTSFGIKQKSFKMPVFTTSSKHLLSIFFNGFSQVYMHHF